MKIIIGSDHGGYKLKESIKKYLEKLGYGYIDFGCNSEESVDYPDFGFRVAEKVAKTNGRGILICGTGIGMSIAANKVKGIRAALCHSEFTAEMSRKHNDSNILCMGGRVLDEKSAKRITKIWLETKFEAGRHEKRLSIIKKYEERC